MIKTNDIKITQDILNLISLIDEFKGAWRALGALSPERLLALRRVATIESIGSSTRIEGSKLSDRDVELLLSNLKIKSFDSRDEQEVAGYAETMDFIFKSWEDIKITENHIKQLHRDLLKYSSKDEYHRGQYKKISNSVAAFNENGQQIGIVFETASPFETPKLMQELIEFINENFKTRDTHPLLIIGIFVVVFLQIHPFQDGNGRLSRILTTLILLRSGYSYVSYSSLESVIEKSKESYYLALRKTQKTIHTDKPDWQPWLIFFLTALKEQVKHLTKKIEHEKITILSLPDLSVQILEYAKDNRRVTVKDMVMLTGVSRNTFKEHFRQLVKKGHLKLHSKGRGAWYSL
jgi:Fic family protein